MTIPLREVLPRVLPSKWREMEVPAVLLRESSGGQVAAFRSDMGLKVLVSIDDFPDGCGVWLHASCSYERQLPRWQDLREVKEVFMGDRPAIQLLPPRRHWMNVHEFTLHLFARLDGDTVPPGLYEGWVNG